MITHKMKATYMTNGLIKQEQIRAMECEIHEKRVTIAAIQKRLIEDDISQESWTHLIHNRNHLLTRIEIVKRKLECLNSSGRFNGYSIEPHVI